MTTEKAIVQQIDYAGLSFEGLMLPDGTYGVYSSQVFEIAQIKTSKSTQSRDLKRLAGKDFKTSKVRVEGIKNLVNLINLDQFISVMMELSFKGNSFCQDFLRASGTEKLERIFDAAFEIKRTEEERELKFAARLNTKQTFRPMTDELQRWDLENWEYGKFVKEFQSHLGIKSGERDLLDADSLIKLGNCQSELKTLMQAGLDPHSAIETWKELNPNLALA